MGDLAPTFLMATACYILHNLLKNKCEWFESGFIENCPTTLSPRSSQRKVKVLVYQTQPLFCIATISSAGPHLPNDQVHVWTLTVQNSCQLLHLLVARFLPVVKELLRKEESETSYRPDAKGL